MGGFNKYQEKPWVQLMCKVLILHETNKSQENHINKTWGNFSEHVEDINENGEYPNRLFSGKTLC